MLGFISPKRNRIITFTLYLLYCGRQVAGRMAYGRYKHLRTSGELHILFNAWMLHVLLCLCTAIQYYVLIFTWQMKLFSWLDSINLLCLCVRLCESYTFCVLFFSYRFVFSVSHSHMPFSVPRLVATYFS